MVKKVGDRVVDTGEGKYPILVNAIYDDGSIGNYTQCFKTMADYRSSVIRDAEELAARRAKEAATFAAADALRLSAAPIIAKVIDKFGEDSYVFKILNLIIEEHPDASHVLDLLAAPTFAKDLRGAVSTAKADIRSEYPIEYREADEKDDFYDDMASEVAYLAASYI